MLCLEEKNNLVTGQLIETWTENSKPLFSNELANYFKIKFPEI